MRRYPTRASGDQVVMLLLYNNIVVERQPKTLTTTASRDGSLTDYCYVMYLVSTLYGLAVHPYLAFLRTLVDRLGPI